MSAIIRPRPNSFGRKIPEIGILPAHTPGREFTKIYFTPHVKAVSDVVLNVLCGFRGQGDP